MSLDAMEKFFVSLGEKPYGARQVFQWIHQKGISNFGEMSNLSKDLKYILEEKTEIKLNFCFFFQNVLSVSYTHLTLPTNREV